MLSRTALVYSSSLNRVSATVISGLGTGQVLWGRRMSDVPRSVPSALHGMTAIYQSTTRGPNSVMVTWYKRVRQFVVERTDILSSGGYNTIMFEDWQRSERGICARRGNCGNAAAVVLRGSLHNIVILPTTGGAHWPQLSRPCRHSAIHFFRAPTRFQARPDTRREKKARTSQRQHGSNAPSSHRIAASHDVDDDDA